MFERFTERAREVVVLAQEEARILRHEYIGTEHLLLGLIREEEGLASRVLESFDVTAERARAQVVRIVGTGSSATPPVGTPKKESGTQVPFTPRCRKVLELSLREALSLGHNYIGTEHILLGLVRENEGVAARILLDFMGSEPLPGEQIRSEVLRMLSGSRRQRAEARPPDAPLTEELIRTKHPDLISIRVKHKRNSGLYGTLVAFDWYQQRCTVRIGMPGVDGRFDVSRDELVLDRRSFIVNH